MKKILFGLIAFVVVSSFCLCYGADAPKADGTRMTPEAKEYFKNAGTAADPSAQDYLATKAAEDMRRAKEEEKRRAEQERQKAEAAKKAEQERQAAEAARKAEQERQKAEAARKYQEERARIKARVDSSPKYTVPNLSGKGSYSQGK